MNLLFVSNKDWGYKTYKYFKKESQHNCFFVKNKSEFDKLIKNKNFKYIFILHWGHYISPKVISKFNVIGFHASELPKFAGGSPIQNQIIRGIKKTYLTSYVMNEKLDEGLIINKRRLILKGNLSDILDRCHLISIKMIDKILRLKNLENLQKNYVVKKYKRLTQEENNIELYRGIKKIYDSIRMVDSVEYDKSYVKTKNNLKISFYSSRIIKNKIYCKAKIELTK